MKVALTGSTGHMGEMTLRFLLPVKDIELSLLILPDDKRIKKIRKIIKGHNNVSIVLGNLKDYQTVEDYVKGQDYVLNLAGVIPPLSDKKPLLSYEANELGTKNLVQAIEKVNPEARFIDITSVALYGHRDYKHPFVRVGDPLFPSAFDVYSANKMRAEWMILESNIHRYAIIRQTAMVYRDMLKANMNDGLMFHTAFNNVLEWSTDEDSARLMRNIILEDQKRNLDGVFWGKVFNLGAKESNRVTGIGTISGGFSLMGGKCQQFFTPKDNIIRNFHGGWYFDGYVLEDLFHYQEDDLDEYWQKVGKANPYVKLGRLVPKSWIRAFAIKPLMKDSNAPAYWYAHEDWPRITAFFGSKETYEKLPTTWDDFYVFEEDKDFKQRRKNESASFVDYGFDFDKKDEEITIEDLRNVAIAHGGKLLSSSFDGDMKKPLEWEDQDGFVFSARPYTILRAGHWHQPLYESYVWDYDRLSKKDKIMASIHYDTFSKEENHRYYFEDGFVARMD